MDIRTKTRKDKKAVRYEWRPSAFWYTVVRFFFDVVFHSVWPLKVYGLSNVPRSGAAVVVSNHLSMVDPFVIGYAAERLVSFMGKEELFRTPFVGFILPRIGAFPVDRSKPDVATIRLSYEVLKAGELLGMFPEGTRSTTGELQELRAGAARIAARTRTPIIPVAVHNTDKALPVGRIFRPARISVRFGEPFELSELYDRNDKGEAMTRALTEIRERIAALS